MASVSRPDLFMNGQRETVVLVSAALYILPGRGSANEEFLKCWKTSRSDFKHFKQCNLHHFQSGP